MSDPDGDAYNVKWWQLLEDKNTPVLSIENPTVLYTTVKVPNNINVGQNLYIVIEVTDNKATPLTKYQMLQIKL